MPTLVVLTGCFDDEQATTGLTAADCPPVVLRPADPRLASLAPAPAPDGAPSGVTVELGPRCGSAYCLAGSDDGFLYRDGDVVHAELNGRRIDVPLRPTSPFRALHAVPGVVMGGGVLVVDLGTGLEVYEGDAAPRSLSLPSVPAGAALAHVQAIDGGLVAWGQRKRERVMVTLIPPKTPQPAAGAQPISDPAGRLAGWVVPGAVPAIVDLAGRRLELPGTSTPEVARLDGAWLVDDKNGGWVYRDGKPPLVAPRDTILFAELGHIYAVPRGRRKKIIALDGDAWVTLFEARPGQGFLGPLPPGSLLERHQLVLHEGAAVVVERIRTESCEVDDRLLLLDLEKRTGRVVVSGGPLRLHPTWGGGRFRFVEADAISEMP